MNIFLKPLRVIFEPDGATVFLPVWYRPDSKHIKIISSADISPKHYSYVNRPEAFYIILSVEDLSNPSFSINVFAEPSHIEHIYPIPFLPDETEIEAETEPPSAE